MLKYISIFFLIPLLLNSQNKHDYIWLLGGNSTPTKDTSYQGFQIDFNIKPRSIYIKDRVQSFTQNNASICDKNGNLLMYTAGCNISDRLSRPMPNGKINEGFVWDFSCAKGDYVVFNGTLFLPSYIDEKKFYLLHKFVVFDPDTTLPGAAITKLLFSTVDMNLNGGYGDVNKKNQVIIEKYLSFSDLTATKHTNLKDWWIMLPGRVSNIYYAVHFSEGQVIQIVEQKIGIPTIKKDEAVSQSCFSPDGRKYALMSQHTGLFIMDFDRTTGKLSNFVNVPNDHIDEYYSTGVAFSPNGRFVYYTTKIDLWQVDLQAQDIIASRINIDTWDGLVERGIWAAQFSQMMLGPDCKIYMRTRTSNTVMHVIHSPNERGKACNFEQHGIQLPARNHASIPNFVNYRLGVQSVCDSSLVMSWNQIPFKQEEQLIIYPLPVLHEINLELLERDKNICTISITDIQGKIIKLETKQESTYKHKLNVAELAAGIYLVKVEDQNGKTYSERMVKN